MSLETFRSVLLVSLVILLVFVLYRRLLSLLGKKKKNDAYATIESWSYNSSLNELLVTLRLPVKDNVHLEVFEHQGAPVSKEAPSEFSMGTHSIVHRLPGLSKGKYFFKISTSNHEVSRYFQVV